MILGTAQLLQESETLEPEHRDLLKKQEKAGFRMPEMINRSLDMVKMELGSYRPDLQMIHLAPLVSRILDERGSLSCALLIDGEQVPRSSHFPVLGEEMLCYEVRERFFEKYSTAGKRGGTGVGTYSARLVVQALGGSVSMSSTEGQRTVVTWGFANRCICGPLRRPGERGRHGIEQDFRSSSAGT